MAAAARRVVDVRREIALELGVPRAGDVPGSVGPRVGSTVDEDDVGTRGELAGRDHGIERHW
jgi:hypothetical protein